MRVIAGRGETQLGGDDLPVFVDVPSWLSLSVIVAIHRAGLSYKLHGCYGHVAPDPEKPGFQACVDRFEFPGEAPAFVHGPDRLQVAARIQRVIDAVLEDADRKA